MRYLAAILFLVLASASGPSLAGFGDGAAAFSLQNYEKAFTEWLPLAEQGDVRAQFKLAILYERGLGVGKDAGQAARWFRLAAGQGHAAAAYRLGFLAGQDGLGEAEATESLKWLRIAAGRGDAKAQYALGALLISGRGVPRDLIAAGSWLLLAQKGLAQTIHEDNVRRSLDLLTGNMSAADIAEAETIAAGWRPEAPAEAVSIDTTTD